MQKLNRRTFIKGSVLGASSAILATPALSNLSRQLEHSGKPKETFIRRPLGKTGIELPVVNMGVMRADNPALVRGALQAGMVLFDTAYGYQKGKNEAMLGEVLNERPRSSFVVATKIPPDDKSAFLDKLDTSLGRLKMNYVDILYLHGATSRDTVLSEETLEALKIAKSSGKARHIGVSTHKNEPEVIQAAIESGVYEVVLSSINFKQDHYPALKAAIARAANAGIGIVGMKSMAGAFHDRERTRPVNCRAALKWVLQDPNVTTTIPGITTFEHLAENVSINSDITLTEQEKNDLALGKPEGGLYCQGCEKCMPQCRRGLPIPEIMRAYMYTYGYTDPSMARTLLTSLHVEENPCRACESCDVVCAKGFAVSEKITDISRMVRVPEEFLG